MHKKEKESPIRNQHESLITSLDLTFIENKPGETLKDRFAQLLKDCSSFYSISAYFRISGFHAIYNSLEKADKIKILIGIGTNAETLILIEEARRRGELHYVSHSEVRQEVNELIENEMSESEDSLDVDLGIQKFIEWIKSGKLEIRAYPETIHAKLYIITFRKGDRDVGRVITGSSNFTLSGLVENLEFNVELKNRADYEYAKLRFEELWENAIDVSENYVQTIKTKTWLNRNITPYEIYLKFLYEYFRDELLEKDEVFVRHLPEGFKRFAYQEQAVLNAKRIIEEHGGCFISDVVGLGKTYIATMLAGQLGGKTLVIAPPTILNKNNPGAWPNVFSDFHVSGKFVSIGKLDEALELTNQEEYQNIIIDEAHRFRNETTISYEKIARICYGKRVILISATPYNNSPKDILAQIKLFQNVRRSTIPGLPDIESFFDELDKKLRKVDRYYEYDKFIEVTKEVAKEIREKVLKYLMVRRTRDEIQKYFADDLKRNNVRFPVVEEPKPIYYQLTPREDEVFMETIRLITQEFSYSRYMPLIYLKRKITPVEAQSQRNLGGFMKVLLVKRLESSFHAFRESIDKFIQSHERFIKEYKNGNVYISKHHIDTILELSDYGDDEEIQKYIDEGKAIKYRSSDFRSDFIKNLQNDLDILRRIKSMWQSIGRDPKLEIFLHELANRDIFKNSKIIVFTESKGTAEYLTDEINKRFGKVALLFHGSAPSIVRDKIIENFDARAVRRKDDYRILVSTDVLSEGVNLHRSNIIINYDIPWNPTKLIQRVGRINRIDTVFDKIHIFNFFPTKQSESEIELTNIARSKIEAFFTLLGGDSAILTEGEPVSSHELFDKILSGGAISLEGSDESELKYLKVIQDVRDKNPELFEKIKQIPRKVCSSKTIVKDLGESASPNSLITFFRRGKLVKFFVSNRRATKEIDFLSAAKIFESSSGEKIAKIDSREYYELLDKNKDAFLNTVISDFANIKGKGIANATTKLLKVLKTYHKDKKRLTIEQERFLETIINMIEIGALPKKIEQKILKSIQSIETDRMPNLSEIITVLESEVSPMFLQERHTKRHAMPREKTEIILSLYLNNT